MNHLSGDPIRAVVNSTDASSGVALKVYRSGGDTEITIASNEFFAVDSVTVAAEDGGAFHVFVGTDATPADPETVVRGTFPTTGATTGIVTQNFPTPVVPPAGGKPWVVAAAGQVNVTLTGRILQA